MFCLWDKREGFICFNWKKCNVFKLEKEILGLKMNSVWDLKFINLMISLINFLFLLFIFFDMGILLELGIKCFVIWIVKIKINIINYVLNGI